MGSSPSAPASSEVRFGLLGPLAVSVAGRDVALGGLRPRTLLALLLTADGATVSEDAIIEAMWGEDPPAGARNSLQSHVSRLRGALAAAGVPGLGDRLARQPRGYRFEVSPGELDVQRVDHLLARARTPTTDTHERVRLLAAARACWRGPALADLADAPGFVTAGLAASRARYDELEATVQDELAAARLDLGTHLELVPELEQLAGQRPDRERTQRLLALALHRSGRTADGLTVLRRYRQRLAEATGLDPSDAFEVLEQRMLAGDDDAPPPPPPPVAAVPTSDPAALHTGGSDRAGGASLAPLVGRTTEMDGLRTALSRSRLVTVTGPGGVGKTRLVRELLAMGVAGERPTAVLELSTIRRPDTVAPALATLLDVRPGSDDGAIDAVASYLAGTDLLLVIDNCEHLLATVVGLVQRLLTTAPGLRVLTTSRVRLGIDGEQVFPLAPLATPAAPTTEGGDPAEESDAVRLFVDRATRSRPTFALTDATRPVVTTLCRQLDGLPLAIELAAAQLTALGLADLQDRLDDRLDLLQRLAHGPDDARHATLRAVVAWSYALLDEPARGCLDQLAVFEGTVPLQAIERVVDLGIAGSATTTVVQVVGQLVDASLVTTADDGRGRLRYGLLETIRAFARERLRDRGTASEVAARHRAWALAFVEAVAPTLDGAGEVEGVAELTAAFPTIRSAWHGAVDDGDLTAAARITAALAGFAHWQGSPEVWSWARHLADAPITDPHLRVALHGAAAQAAYLTGDLAAAERHARAGLGAAGDADAPRRWWCVVALHVLAMYRADYPEAERLARAAAEAADVTATWAVVLAGNIALARLYGGDVERARAALAACRGQVTTTSSTTATAWVLYVDGEIAGHDDPAHAVAVLEECIDRAGAVGATFVSGVASVGLAAAATRLGDAQLALAWFPDVIRHWHRAGMWVQQWNTLRNLATLLVSLGRDAPAAVLLAAAEHDDGAAAVTGEGAGQLKELHRGLVTRLGAAEVDRLARTARTMTREQVVAFALEAAARS